MIRLAIFTTHPIQYQVPWFRELSRVAGLEVEVVFSYIPSAKEQGVGFGEAFKWDIPLLSGYRYRVLPSISMPGVVPRFASRWAFGLGAAFDAIKPDVVIILGWQEISLVQVMLFAKHRGVPIILRGESNALRARSKLIALIHHRYFAACDAFLAIGKANAEFYRVAGVPENRIRTAAYFIDNARFKGASELFRSERDAIRSSWSIPEGSTCFAFVGKLEPKKRVFDYLQALKIARARGANASGLVVGSGIQLTEAKRIVEQAGLPVSFAGFLNQSQIPRGYVAADVLVLPSDYGETWGLVVNEAMATGIPVIVSNRVGAANDLVIEGHTGHVFPYADSSALADAMLRLASDDSERRKMGARAQGHVLSNYSIERAVENTKEAISLIVNFPWNRKTLSS